MEYRGSSIDCRNEAPAKAQRRKEEFPAKAQRRKEEVPAKAQRRKEIRFCRHSPGGRHFKDALQAALFFAPLRLCGKLLFAPLRLCGSLIPAVY